MKKKCTNCIWYDDWASTCINGNSSYRGEILTELGDPNSLVCGHHEEKPKEEKK